MKMKTKLIEKEIKYIGSQLAPHWIYKNFEMMGDAIVAFKGECEVKLTEMVDIEDVINNEPIYSKYMLSFITEQFGADITEGVLRQRLLMTTIKEVLEDMGIIVKRSGDDLYVDDKNFSILGLERKYRGIIQYFLQILRCVLFLGLAHSHKKTL